MAVDVSFIGDFVSGWAAERVCYIAGAVVVVIQGDFPTETAGAEAESFEIDGESGKRFTSSDLRVYIVVVCIRHIVAASVVCVKSDIPAAAISQDHGWGAQGRDGDADEIGQTHGNGVCLVGFVEGIYICPIWSRQQSLKGDEGFGFLCGRLSSLEEED
ncbi:hypothetical protein HRR83_003381 [Exophiala dermatitidis]|nr:hypothetical protein HRR74_004460 [Exophiala dermatitidis]KAJ4521063.1 hypothetical protein HRR73_003404 [Exophiala dermatitidis]KAJ4547646.1 hypothetical protein HRR76_000278 [Exophiala dermatitidis]KAJ4553584.1 hypothetical protein HRR77_001967 [Exophiala dermatitidis]KAJ4577912.1 hypothetical protein HRR79_001237 [Exophiala dermatitidis]